MRQRAKKGVSRPLPHSVFSLIKVSRQLLSDEEKVILAEEEAALKNDKDCLIM
jgi:hypothetical protein